MTVFKYIALGTSLALITFLGWNASNKTEPTCTLTTCPLAISTPHQEGDKAADADSPKTLQRADVLLITGTELADAWQPLANWKTMTGRPTKIVTTESIDQNYSGDDIQQKIRECCLEHINQHNTRWVILGGDSSGDGGIVPDRDTDHSECSMLPYDNIPTDLYYISDTDWDANDDGKYGSFDDDIDAVSYVNTQGACIGRIPLRSTDDVAAYTEKVMAYESQYPVGDFAGHMVYTCPEEAAYPKLETSIAEVAEIWRTGNLHRFFGNRTPWDDIDHGDHDLSPSHWVQMINDRYASKIHMHGHGVLDRWVLEQNQTVDSNAVALLKNERAYPVITTVSCLTGQYDDEQDPCITESMLRQPKAGAIAILAPSREGVPFVKRRSDLIRMISEGKMDGTTTAYTKFWQHALAADITIGEAFRNVKRDMESDARENDGFHMAQCELNLLGDPTLSTRPAPPENFVPRLRRSGKEIRIRGVANANVCIWDGKDEYLLLKTTAKGRLNADVATDADNYSIAIYADGYNTWYENAVTTDADSKTDTDEKQPAANQDAEAPTADNPKEPVVEAPDRTYEEFKEYVAGKLSNLTDDQLDAICNEVDEDKDGKISPDEFDNRMQGVRRVLQAPAEDEPVVA